MKNLIEISKIVTKKKVKKIEIFNEHNLKHKNSKFNEFYEALMSQKFKNDRDAASFLYSCTPTDDRYRQLKSRFKKRLLNTLFFLDVNLPSTSTYDRAYYSCNKDWTLVKILISNYATNTASSLAKQILTTALRFKFADVIVNCSRILRKHCAEIGDEKNYEIYDQYSKQYQNVLDAEIRSEELYQRVFMNYYKPASKNTDLKEKIDIYCDALVGLSEIYDSPIVMYNMYLVWAYRYEMLADYTSALEVCENAEQYIEESPQYHQDDKVATFQLKKMSAYLHLQDSINGFENAEKCLKSFPEGSITWFEFMEYYFLLAMHTKNYVRALAIFEKATSNTKFRKITGVRREKWKIYEIYSNYIIESNSDNPVYQVQRRKNFSISRFLNVSILYSKEQRIFTILMVTAQILFFLNMNGKTNASERIDRLKSYATRQLKKEEYHRAIQFIYLLQQLVRADFDVSKMSNKEKYLTRLKETKFKYRGLITELEIIPYEQLWEHIEEKLSKEKR